VSTDPAPDSTEERLRRLEAQMNAMSAENRRLAERNQRLHDQNQDIVRQNRELGERYEALRRRLDGSTTTTPKPATPIFSEPWPGPAASEAASRDSEKDDTPDSGLQVEYDDGFRLGSSDSAKLPYELKINFWNQFRYTAFSRAVETWTDSAGVTRPVAPRNDFQINRGRITFSGFALTPRLGYSITIDYNTLRRQNLDLIQAWVDYEFSRALKVHWGKLRVLGTREWQTAASDVLGLERSMATTFFRPSFTAGVWASGEPIDGLRYGLLIGNGFNTASLDLLGLDDNFAYAGDLIWEPLGDFGRYFSDLEWHETPAIRLGTNLVYSRQEGSQADALGPEQTQIRLSDGTLFTDLGALAPNVTVTSYFIYLYTLDLGFKYRGLSLNGEYFCRWLQGIEGTGPIPSSRGNLFDHGAYAQVGYFVVPERLELYAKTSQITGPFGSGSEWGGGLSWFPRADNSFKVTIDATKVNSSPTSQDRTGYEAGASGTLIRAQLQTRF
jgi:hypothetical protein